MFLKRQNEWDYFDLPKTAQMGELNAFHSVTVRVKLRGFGEVTSICFYSVGLHPIL